MIRLVIKTLLLLTAMSPGALGQLAASPNYRLDDMGFAGSSGGTASVGYAAFVAVHFPTGDEVLSANYRCQLGFLSGSDPERTNAPVIFGITPDCGPTMGDVPVTVSGLNFNKFGAGPTVSGTIGGTSMIGLSVISDTTITAKTPTGTPGAKNVVVSSTFGSDTLVGGYTYTAGLVSYGTGTPGCAGSQLMSALNCPSLGNATFTLTCTHAPATSLGLCLVTNSQDLAGSDPFALGILLHVDFFLATEVFGLDIVSDASGFGTVVAPVPNNPFLLGSNYFAQAVWVETACVMPTVANLSSSKGLQIVIEP